MPGGNPVKIGPFVGGLNNISSAGESKDNEVVELINFELSLDTSLVSRPPIEVINGTASNLANQWDVLGVYRITSANWYAIVNVPTGATTYEVRAYPLGDFTASATVIKAVSGLNNKVVSYVQYNDWCYFNVNTGATDTGFRWKSGSGTESIAAMPRGRAMLTWEDRIWITADGTGATGNYVWWSTVDSTGPKPNTFNTSVDFFNTDPGSGGLNTGMIALTNSLLIFKEDATYRFSFPTSPKNGDLSNVSRMIGTAGPTSVVPFESYCFVYDQGRVYELINTRFSQINLNVNFDFDATMGVDGTAPGVDLSIVGRRLVIRYFNAMYVYNIDSRTWSQWQSINGTPGKFYEMPSDSASSVQSNYLSASRGATQAVGANRITDPAFIDPELNSTRLASANGSASISSSKLTLTSTSDSNTNTLVLQDEIPVSPSRQMNFLCNISANTLSEGRYLKVLIDYTNRDGSTTQSFLPNANVEIRRNLVRNPRGTTTTDYSVGAGGGTPTISTVASGGPTESSSFIRATAGTAGWTYIDVTNGATGNNLVTPGKTYTVSASHRSSLSGTLAVYVQWVNSSNTAIGTSSVLIGANTPNVWTRYSFTTAVAPAGAVRAGLIWRLNGTTVAGSTADLTALQFEVGSVATPFLHGSIPDNAYQNFEWTGTADASESTVAGLNTPVGPMQATFTVPANAITARVSLQVVGNGLVTVDTCEFKQADTTSPVSLMRLIDQYQNTTSVEYIRCSLKTKAYDYQANSVFKRLFLWGLDVKTNRPITMTAYPLGKRKSVTWDDLENYTWDQLEAGTADNPLSFLGVSNSVIDTADASVDISENGRFFVKALKSLRFRQIQFEVEMSTLGNADTGPVKLFSLTTYTKASQMVVDKAT